MSVLVADATEVLLPEAVVLAVFLEHGRIEQSSAADDMIKLVTAEAVVRGKGRVAVRRSPGRTLVSALEGSFRIETAGRAMTLDAGFGIVLERGAVRQVSVRLPSAPEGLAPGSDPQFVERNEPLTLRFSSAARSHHVQVLGLDSKHVFIARDVEGPPVTLSLPWLGTFRWRISSRDASGLEGQASRDGLIAVVSK